MCGLFQCVPYLISMCTDTEKVIRVKADQQLQEIDKKYPGFIHVSLSDRDYNINLLSQTVQYAF